MGILRWSILASSLIACGPGSRGNEGTPPDAAPHSGDGSAAGDTSRVYAHTATTLFRINTVSLAPEMIGSMTGLGTESMTDIAIDKTDHMVGITTDKLYAIDPTNGTVTLVKDLSASATGFSSLSYIPSDLNDPNSADILVSANNQGAVYQIDPLTGSASMIGSYGTVTQGKVVSSGDLVGVRGLGIFATVHVGTGADDYFAKIDPATWKATPLAASTGFKNIFGLGFWAGKFYGFVDAGAGAGKVIQIDQSTGVGTLLTSNTDRWYGAGVTTDAPIIE